MPYTPSLNYDKLKGDLVGSADRRKAFLLQALRWVGGRVSFVKPGFHIIVSDVRIVSVAEYFVNRSGRLSLVSIHSSLTSLSQNILSSDRDDHMETSLNSSCITSQNAYWNSWNVMEFVFYLELLYK